MQRLEQVKIVAETIDVSELNKFLDLGWFLINTATYVSETGHPIIYSIGWAKDMPPKYPE